MIPRPAQLLLALVGWLVASAGLAGLLLARAATAAEAETADANLARVIAMYRTEGATVALPEFERHLKRFRETHDPAGEAVASRYVGECHWRLGNFGEARQHLDAALALAHESGQSPLEGRTLNVLGLLEWDLGNYRESLDDFDQAHAIADRLGDRPLSASVLNNRGLVRDELGDYSGSLTDYEASLALFEQEQDRRGQGDALGNIGGVHLLLGRYEQALDYQRRALTISEALESKPAMTIDHGNIALSLLGLGRTGEALEHFDRALALARETGMEQEAAYWQRGKGNALVSQGHYDLGLELHREALATYERSGARGLLLDAQHDMGMLMLTLGDPASAEAWFQQAVQLAREIGQQQAVTENLIALGDLQYRRQRPGEARALYEEGLRRATESGESQLRALASLRLARVDRAQGKHEDASSRAAEALQASRAIGAAPIVAEAWFALGEAARGQKEFYESLMAYDEAELTAGSDGDPDLLWQLHYGRAQSLEQSGDLQAAVRSMEASVAVIESVRERLREERFRAGWVEDKYRVYIDLVRLQLELDRTRDAFSTAERLRARSFLTQLDRSRPAAFGDKESQQEALLRERIRQLQSALDSEQKKAPPERRLLAIESFSRELTQAERDYQAYLDDQGLATSSARSMGVPDVANIQNGLRASDAIIEYVVGERGLVIFVLRRDSLRAVTSAVRRDQLRVTTDLLRELIQQPGGHNWKKPAATLSTLLVGPLRQQGLLDGVAHLSLVPHGVLNYLPFGLLPLDEGGERLLVEEYTLSLLPAAAALVYPSDAPGDDRSLLALAPERSRLQFAPLEARSVVEMFQPNASLLVGKAATESAFKSRAGDYQLLHFATHGVFNKQNPLLSGLELESDDDNDGMLEVHEILGLSLDAELVTLSACQTGLGSGWFTDIPAGDDFVSLTRAFLAAGSQNVLASLWEVDDRSTVNVMEGFYQRFGAGSERDQAEALAAVQRELKSSADFYHPFYWAAFVLVGQRGSSAPGYAKGT
jgi:CHAT domain-containing protein